jgi:methanol metabolism-related c-type cytochrome
MLSSLASVTQLAHADDAGNPAPVSASDGEYKDKEGNPTYKIASNGTVDWYTNIGYARYGANCLACHGPDGLGSSYAPSLVDALKTMDYSQFTATVIQGKQNVSASQDLVMPSFGTNKNVMCYLDAIYIYLRARSDNALGRERPSKVETRPTDWEKQEDSCMG